MEYFPSDLHHYLASFLDESTRILFPLTCKSIYESLGFENIMPKIAVVHSVRDNNIELMFYFLDNCNKKQRGFYQTNILVPALHSNSREILKWFYSKKYRIMKEYIEHVIYTVSLDTLDEYVIQRLQMTYNNEILSYVLQGDRVDILTERYFCTNKIYTLNISDVRVAIEKDAVKCFFKFIDSTTDDIRDQCLREAFTFGGEKIISSCMTESLLLKITFHTDNIDRILLNHRCLSISFFQLLLSHHTLTSEQLVLVIQHKSFEVVKLALGEIEIEQEHCKRALKNLAQNTIIYNEQKFDIARYIISRYSGKLNFTLTGKLCFNTPCDLQNIIAEKLDNIECMECCIFNESNFDLFSRFVDDGRFQERHFVWFHTMKGALGLKMLRIYLSKCKIPEDEHLALYSNFGEDFYQLMIEMKQTVSLETIRKRLLFLRRQERKAQKERESKRLCVR